MKIRQNINSVINFMRKVRPILYFLVRKISTYLYGKFIPIPPHSAKVGIAIKGLLIDYTIANPINDDSPHFLLGYFEPYVTRVLKSYLQKGQVSYDIGANIGYHSLQMSKLVGSQGCVYAFEPGPVEFDLLRWNITTNKISNIDTKNMAISKETGIGKFAVFDSPGVNHLLRENSPSDAHIIEVPMISLDDFIFSRGNREPDFIKIDVEGSELFVLLGANNVLKIAKPVVVCEVWKETSEQVLTYMTNLNYTWSYLHQDSWLSEILFVPDVIKVTKNK